MNDVETIKHLFLDMGAAWVLWLLFILSIISVGLCIERVLFYHRRGDNLQALANLLDKHLSLGQWEQASRELQQRASVPATIAAAGLRLAHLGPTAAGKAMDSALSLERDRLEQRLSYLGTLGNNAPFIGLLGTVIGVIRAFEELGHGAPGHASAAADQVASQAVMSSIAEALVATAVGIAVALPAVAAYNYFQRKIASLLSGTDVVSNLVLAYLSSTAPLERDGPQQGYRQQG